MDTDSKPTAAELQALEALIDTRGAEDVLIAISEICGAKAEHIEADWQDHTPALRWFTLEGAVGCVVPRARGL